MTIADITAISTVSALHLIFPIDYEEYPRLYDWYQRLRKMQFYQHNEEGIFKLRYLLEMVAKVSFPSPFRNGKSQFIKSDEPRNEGGYDETINEHYRTDYMKLPKRHKMSSSDSENDFAPKSEILLINSSSELKRNISANCRCKMDDDDVTVGKRFSKIRRQLEDDSISEYCQGNYYAPSLQAAMELDLNNAKTCEGM